jgi:hypothetical protein
MEANVAAELRDETEWPADAAAQHLTRTEGSFRW